MSNTERLAYIDNIKGIGIFLVVLGHITKNVYIINFIYSFHIPLFFFISGMLINPSKHSLKDFVINKFKRLIVPYLAFSVISLVIWASAKVMMGEQISIQQQILGILRANVNLGDLKFNIPLWFLPCLFVTEILFVLIYKIINKNTIFTFIIILIISIFSFNISNNYHPFYFWEIEVSLCQILFLYIGHLSNKYYFNTNKINKYNLIILLTTIITTQIILSHFNGRVDVSSSRYESIPLYIFNSIIGICFTYTICLTYMRKKIFFITQIGKYTLYIMGIHAVLIIFIKKIIHIDYTKSITASILITFTTITVIILSISTYKKIYSQRINE